MIEFLLAGIPLLLLVMTILQLSLLWMGKGAVDTAAHLAARKFARIARVDFRNARQEAFLEAYRTCRNRPGRVPVIRRHDDPRHHPGRGTDEPNGRSPGMPCASG